MEKVCGIYAIISESDNLVYIGSSVDIKKRYSCHLGMLRGGRHYTKELQEVFDKDNNSIKLSILEECEFEDLTMLEEKYIEHFNQVGWNVLNKKVVFQKSRLSEESRALLSLKQRGEGNGNAKLREDDVREIKQAIDDGVMYSRIADEFHISQGLISNINRGVRWSHV